MFLIFSLGRPDVFPHDDLGIRVALRNLYSLNDLPDRAASLQIAAPWRPFATIASWYCWRSHELPRKKEGQPAVTTRAGKPTTKGPPGRERK
jgi:DNA-3-methyladenine glycosylase II